MVEIEVFMNHETGVLDALPIYPLIPDDGDTQGIEVDSGLVS